MQGSSSHKKLWKPTAVRDKSLEDSFMLTTNGGQASFQNKARHAKSVVGLNQTRNFGTTDRSNASGSQRYQKSLGRQS